MEKAVELGPPTHAEEWALRKGLDIAARHLPASDFKERITLATEIGEALTEAHRMADAFVVLEALLWAWTNAMGRMPDANTMSDAEIASYWDKYEILLTKAVGTLTDGATPDDTIKKLRRENRF